MSKIALFDFLSFDLLILVIEEVKGTVLVTNNAEICCLETRLESDIFKVWRIVRVVEECMRIEIGINRSLLEKEALLLIINEVKGKEVILSYTETLSVEGPGEKRLVRVGELGKLEWRLRRARIIDLLRMVGCVDYEERLDSQEGQFSNLGVFLRVFDVFLWS